MANLSYIYIFIIFGVEVYMTLKNVFKKVKKNTMHINEMVH